MAYVVLEGVEFNARDQRRARAWRRGGGGFDEGGGFGEGADLERTQRLGAADPDDAAARRALEETWPADGAQGGGFGQAGAGRGRSGPVSRRVLFAAGGLALVGGCGVAVSSRLSSSGSRIEFVKWDHPDVELRVPSVAKAQELLGWRARVDLEEGLLRTIYWYRNR